jgi:hypothetical protein
MKARDPQIGPNAPPCRPLTVTARGSYPPGQTFVCICRNQEDPGQLLLGLRVSRPRPLDEHRLANRSDIFALSGNRVDLFYRVGQGRLWRPQTLVDPLTVTIPGQNEGLGIPDPPSFPLWFLI